MFMIFSIYYIFKYISIWFEKLWRAHKKLIKWLQEAKEWGISGPVSVKVRHLSTSFLYGFDLWIMIVLPTQKINKKEK